MVKCRDMNRQAWLWLVVGIALRLILICQPPVEDNSWIRQTQTADAIQNWIAQGHPSWDTAVSWRGDTGARLAQELPLYNFIVYAATILGLPLSMAGRGVSILLWGACFIALQMIWKRWLTSDQSFWANLLFVFSPLSIAFGQAVMPEMMVLLLAVLFVLGCESYLDRPRLILWWGIVGLGTLGCLIKLPAFFHLYLIIAGILWLQSGWKGVLGWRVICGALFTGICLWAWSRKTETVNAAYFSDWSASANLRGFLGQWQDRLRPVYWVRLGFYLLLLAGTPVVWGVILLRGKTVLKDLRQYTVLVLWAVGLIFFILLWGPRTCMGHAYYCLTFLVPLCALFGKACVLLRPKHAPGGWAVGLIAGVVGGCLPMAAYLMRPDETLRESTAWMRENIPAEDLVIIKANHSVYTREYPQLPGFSYLSGRRTWIWSPYLSDEERARALKTSRWLVETLPPSETSWWESVRRQIKGHERPVEDISELKKTVGAELVTQGGGYRVFQTSPGK
jgi:4-amino-4-deoxy-L-arabinose transferase-like glycosyltransferase